MNQELLVILNSLYELDRQLAVMLHSSVYMTSNLKVYVRKCLGVECSYCPVSTYKFKTDHLKETIIQIADLS